ncbi:uncharacterized protein RCC_11406 [Ramularia collo-cygni]|uniref:Prolyl 4-hydroxylase alpha subunit Fe(2+) 2OG dioxygenase domain-containing protein n=1 Tax=Ramularia collo-cygni TaxID=112498 RepID=A0A2D3VJK2_9PEZI|nr:uncharacterized protein RCC_11406 [Ramularia collo-cygni]CZT25737.1 uncharacterized protein RCC_11406 [Ramularia collo-cygni]
MAADTEPQTSEPYRWDTLSHSVRSLLDSLDSEGSFCAQGSREDINPGLQVEGVGGIGMPISAYDAQRLIRYSRQAPFGKGSETIVDITVRNTWEIDAAKIKCAHPKWPSIEQSILDSVTSQLGIVGGSEFVKLEPYKLLIYGEGAMFKPHRDTEKAEGMFGTLVIALSSPHQGGDVAVSFNGKQKVMETSPDSAWSTSFLAWYGDVLHEVRPVTKGYRIVLTYNMMHTGPSAAPGISEGDPRLVTLQSVLKDWSRDVDVDDEDRASDPLPGYLIYMLEHQYTDESLCLTKLKGRDRTRVEGVLSIGQASDCECFLATIEKKERGGCDGFGPEDYAPGELHSIVDVEEQSVHIRSIVNVADGNLIVENVTLDDDEAEGLIMRKDEEDDPFEGEPCGEEFEGWTGNEGARTTLWYRKSALIIMPGRSNLGYFMAAARDSEDGECWSTNFCNLMNYYRKKRNSGGELDYLVGLVCQGPITPEGKEWLALWPDGTWPKLECSGDEIGAAAAACLRAGWLD